MLQTRKANRRRCFISQVNRLTLTVVRDLINFCFRFPFNNSKILSKWIDFVIESGPSDSTKQRKQKKISRYSSVCSQHFTPSDFSQAQFRKFLRKDAVPSIRRGLLSLEKKQDDEHKDDEPIEVQMEDPLGSDDYCGLCRTSSSTLNMDEYYFVLIRKCLPWLLVNENFIQKLCVDCVNQLNSFSSFIDKVVGSHDVTPARPVPSEVSVFRNPIGNIKVEPISNFEEEPRVPSIQVVNFTEQSPSMLNRFEPPLPQFPPQKKCEILEIVDIKPFHSFDGSMQHETYDDEDEIQILSPKQLKVELTDPDEDGSNELELIRNYVYISTIFLKDHNYTKPSEADSEQNVKQEFDDDIAISEGCIKPNKSLKICHLCQRTFKTFKKYLVHKSLLHQPVKMSKRLACGSCHKLFKDESKLKSHSIAVCRRKREKIRQVIEMKAKAKPRIKVKKAKRVRKINYSCPTCSKSFSGPKNLYQHKLSHASSFHCCSLCDKRFKRPHGLKQHFKSIHENEKSHVCPICSHAYLLRADMAKCRHSKLKKSQ